AKSCFDPRERDEAYCYNHRTKEKTQCAVVNCHEKAGGRAWEYCDKCCTDIATLGQVTGCDEHDTNNLSCSKCRKIDIFKEYNEIRKEALKAKNVTFYALNKTKPSTSYDNTNSTVSSMTSPMGSQPSFVSTVSSNSTRTNSLFGTNPRQTTSTSAGGGFGGNWNNPPPINNNPPPINNNPPPINNNPPPINNNPPPINNNLPPINNNLPPINNNPPPINNNPSPPPPPNNNNQGNPLLQPANVNQALINQMAKMEETIQVLHTEVKENKETCTNCNRKGHVAKNCYAKSIKYNDVPQKPCHKCGRKGHWAKDCYASKQCNNCNGKGHLAKDCNKEVKCYGCGNFGHIAKECQKKKKSQDKRNNNNSQSYNGRPRRQNAYISQEEDTLSTLAATVGELAKKIENLKGDGSAKNTNEHPQTVPDCVTCDAEIWGTKVKAIVDTGSSGSIISKQCLDQLKRKIEESSNVSLIGINGQKHRPLGIVRNVHVTLDNKHPIEVTMQVTEATNYELILGVDWLRAINGVISIGEKILTTTAYGTTNKHPIKVEKKPNIIEQPGDEEYEEESIQEEIAFLNRMITDHKPEQMIRTFTNIEWEDLEEEQKPTINRELTLKQQQRLDRFLQKHDDMFAGGLYELGHTQEEVHSIPTNCPFPQNQRAYHYPPKYNEFIKEEIQQMLEHGIIRESTSSWASPIVVVKKKNNKLRFCVDYRKLNAYTEQDKYPLPLIADIFDSLEGSKYFSSLDLASGYWQMEVAEEDKKKTAFISKHGLYEFNRMPFGLTNAPASFQRLMNKVLSKEIGRFVVVYLDDINIYSKSFEEHLEHLEIVFSRLRQAGLKLGKDKCSFAKTQLEFLGHIVGRDGLQPDPKKVEKVRDWPTPKTNQLTKELEANTTGHGCTK
ncbi:8148_t:CDS:2, partial [Entrophospora sp. SA101]